MLAGVVPRWHYFGLLHLVRRAVRWDFAALHLKTVDLRTVPPPVLQRKMVCEAVREEYPWAMHATVIPTLMREVSV